MSSDCVELFSFPEYNIFFPTLSQCMKFEQVILDVVYNHTNEAGGFVTSFRGIDNKVKRYAEQISASDSSCWTEQLPI